MTKGSDSRMARTTLGSFSPKAWVAMRAPMSRKRYGWPAWSRSRTARYGPTDSPGSKATGSEKKRLCEADSSAACDAGRYCWTSSSSVRSLSCKRSEEHTSELQSLRHIVCRHLLDTEKHKSDNKK